MEDDLTAYYDAEARAGTRVDPRGFRVELQEQFAASVRAEARVRIIDVGAGPGVDTALWAADGFDVTGVDLGVENCFAAARRGLQAVPASLYELPFASGSFDALWTMSTFVHVPHDRFDDAIGEMLRVLRPGAPLGIGTWGGRDFEGVPEFGEFRPYRFFSLADHERWRAMLGAHGDLERFETFPPTDPSGWEYQFAVLRSPT
ncbi:MAG: class I SAM-dependent methyltransferase [Ilumatobacteraceae bacterium]